MDLTGIIKEFIWDPPEAVQFMFMVYHVELLTDLVVTFKARELTIRIGYRKCIKVLFSCIGAAMLLFIGTGSAKYVSGFGWLPQTIFFLILSGLVLLIVRRCSKLGIVNPIVADILEIRITSLINSKKNENHLEGGKDRDDLPDEGPAQTPDH